MNKVPSGSAPKRGKVTLQKGLEHLAKVFLYMSLSEARRIDFNEADKEAKKLENLGPKKRAKAQRKIKGPYNRIMVGPETWPPEESQHKGAGEVTPHMRRGHFRNQPHGPRNELRKLVFIKPTLVRGDLTNVNSVSTKNYKVQ